MTVSLVNSVVEETVEEKLAKKKLAEEEFNRKLEIAMHPPKKERTTTEGLKGNPGMNHRYKCKMSSSNPSVAKYFGSR